MGDRLRAGIPSRYVTSQLGQLSLASLPGSLNRVPASAGGKGGNITSVGRQVTAIHLLLTYLLTYKFPTSQGSLEKVKESDWSGKVRECKMVASTTPLHRDRPSPPPHPGPKKPFLCPDGRVAMGEGRLAQ